MTWFLDFPTFITLRRFLTPPFPVAKNPFGFLSNALSGLTF